MARPFKAKILVAGGTVTNFSNLLFPQQKNVTGTVEKKRMISRADLVAGVSGPTTRPGGPAPTSWTQTSGALELAF